MKTADLTKIAHLISESERLTYLDPDASLKLAEQASQLAVDGSDPTLALLAWKRYGCMLFAFGDIPQGQICHLKALTIAETEDLKPLRGEILQELASAYYTQSSFDEAIDYWGDCLVDEGSGFSADTRIHAHIGLGQVYFAHEQFAMALHQHLHAQSLTVDQTSLEMRACILINLAADHLELEQYDDAERMLDLAWPLALTQGHKEYQGEILIYQANVALGRRNTRLARDFVAQAQTLRRVWYWGETSEMMLMGRILITEGRLEEALEPIAHALKRALEIGSGHTVFKAHHLLAQVYRALGQQAESEQHYRQYQEAYKRIVGTSTYAKLKALEQQLAR
ncbi:tetratricopeptide repeat protein [Chitinolyticbacter albus]|uniref:tetratricopeptide repeat protein n=1 Tax=Chitinolyticbacter albus TaxID=2961951 RepID=UPI00210A3F33|nr:tetratricopeptide repeat protein [Chitinolyticbacter albus]